MARSGDDADRDIGWAKPTLSLPRYEPDLS
jgi:hypothetical protein